MEEASKFGKFSVVLCTSTFNIRAHIEIINTMKIQKIFLQYWKNIPPPFLSLKSQGDGEWQEETFLRYKPWMPFCESLKRLETCNLKNTPFRSLKQY